MNRAEPISRSHGHRHRRKRRRRMLRLGIILGVVFSLLVVVVLFFFSKPKIWWEQRVPGFNELYRPPL